MEGVNILDLQEIFTYPYDNDLLLRKQKSIKRELLARKNISYTTSRIAILGGSTVDNIKNILELFLLESGILPTFYQSEYNKFYEDAVFGNAELDKFSPEIVIVFSSITNIVNWPKIIERKTVWTSLKNRYNAVIIQNNFELPYEYKIGSLSSVIGQGHFVAELNRKFSDYAQDHKGFFIHDLNFPHRKS